MSSQKSAFERWYSMKTEDVLSSLNSKPDGLSSEDAKKRLEEYGPNKLPEQKQRGPVVRFLLQFHNVLIYVLIVAAIITALMDHWIDTWVIAAVVLLNAIIGFVQEGKAERALEGIRNMLSLKATVVRNGKRTEINAEELVPGDIVRLESGDKVPADLRLLKIRNFKVEESALTGESQPVEKKTDAVDDDAVVGDRTSLAFNGTMVTYGRAEGVVVATGEKTELGKISTMMSEVEQLTTPLLRQIDNFGKWLSVVILVITAGFFALGYYVYDYPIDELFLAVIGLAVASIPEGLPAIMTITLAIGVQRMAARNAIIRKLPSVETLGSVTVICSDKTGTLTKNEMTARTVITPDKSYEVEGTGYKPEGDILTGGNKVDPEKESGLKKLIETVYLCNEAEINKSEEGVWHLKGDPTEGSLVALAMKSGLSMDGFERLDTIPFESDHKFMATLNRKNGDNPVIYLKGAPERILEMCSAEAGSDGKKVDEEKWLKVIESVAAKGQRVIAAAYRETDSGKTTVSMDDITNDFTFLGIIGMIDPPRPEAIKAIEDCQNAGIRVKMITGDHAITASAIGKELGIATEGKTITGNELEKMSDEEMVQVARENDIFARTSPEHKLRLVRALQANKQVVAMTGDGVNDAPALKRADVGVAMGIKGTEVTKDAADMVLADDNFASIANAVEEGRTIYDNLRKAILFILPTNGAEALVIMVALLLGLAAMPITPAQILWVNMVTAVTLALALSFEPTERGVMKRKPRDPGSPILGGYFLWRILFVSVIIGGMALLVFDYMKDNGYDLELARTMAVNILVAGQAFYLYNCRHMRDPALSYGFFDNKVALVALAALLVLQMVFVYAPFMNLWFGTMAVPAVYWLYATAAGLVVFILVEIEKVVYNQFFDA